MQSAFVVAAPSPRRHRVAFALLLGLAAMPAWAANVPQTVQLTSGLNTGGTSFLDGFTRTTPGWALVQYLDYSDLDSIKDANGHDSPAFRKPRIQTTSLLNQIVYVTPYKPFGGVLGFNTIVPVINMNSSFGNGSPATLSDNGLGLGDVTFGPYIQMLPVMRNGRPVFSQRFEFDVIVPVGKFDRDRDLNQGAGYWSTIANWAFTVLPTRNWEISARLNYIYNFRADKAANVPELEGFNFRNGKAGDAAWINFASSVAVAPNFRVGINGYYLQQLHDNRTNGQRVANTRQKKFYLGPGVSWTLDPRNFVNVNLYLPVKVENAAAGNVVNLFYVHQF
ncbi:SphA family protein [Pseudomonas aeruginosa]